MVAQQIHGSQAFKRGDITRTSHHHIRFSALIGTRPLPDADAAGAMLDRGFHAEVLRRALLASDDDVDVIAAAKAVIRDGQHTIGVRREIDANDVRLFIYDVVDEDWAVTREAT